MTWLNLAAREEGKYRAIGGHKARPSETLDPETGRMLCGICRRPLTWREDKHAGGRRHRRTRC